MESELPSLRAKNIKDQKRRADRPPIARSTWCYCGPVEVLPARSDDEDDDDDDWAIFLQIQSPQTKKTNSNGTQAENKAQRTHEVQVFQATLAAVDRVNSALEDASNLYTLTTQEKEARRAKYDMKQYTN